jgi:orotate phosphoribosyltransferase
VPDPPEASKTVGLPEASKTVGLPEARHPELRDHLAVHSVKHGNFVLKSGKKSTWFIDAKQTLCRPEGMLLAARAALEVLPQETDAVGGLTMGADPLSFAIAAIGATMGRRLTCFSVRKEEKDHGPGGRIAGVMESGARVVITEDTVTRGVSMLEAARAVTEAGGIVVMLLAVVDRAGSCADLARDAGYEFHALVTAQELGLPYEGA